MCVCVCGCVRHNIRTNLPKHENTTKGSAPKNARGTVFDVGGQIENTKPLAMFGSSLEVLWGVMS